MWWDTDWSHRKVRHRYDPITPYDKVARHSPSAVASPPSPFRDAIKSGAWVRRQPNADFASGG